MCSGKGAIPLRPHHGVCLAWFQGHGYSDAFSAHMWRVLEELLANRSVRLTVQPDEICAACPRNLEGACVKETEVALLDRGVLAACRLEEGAELPFLELARIIQERMIVTGKRDFLCGSCQWKEYCQSPGRWAELTK
jgi:hypothetical protein